MLLDEAKLPVRGQKLLSKWKDFWPNPIARAAACLLYGCRGNVEEPNEKQIDFSCRPFHLRIERK